MGAYEYRPDMRTCYVYHFSGGMRTRVYVYASYWVGEYARTYVCMYLAGGYVCACTRVYEEPSLCV